jgi:probable rRNA maturation factor
LNRIALTCRGRAAHLATARGRLLVRRLSRAMRAAGLDAVELSLTLSDDRELLALNRRYAEEDHATDVLSFSQREGGAVPHAGGRRPLGDVIISVEHACRQAAAQGRALAGELFHLAVHGLAHLCGYDHRDADEERVMFGYEAALRAAALAPGPVRPVSAPRRRTARRSPPPSSSADSARPARIGARGTTKPRRQIAPPRRSRR